MYIVVGVNLNKYLEKSSKLNAIAGNMHRNIQTMIPHASVITRTFINKSKIVFKTCPMVIDIIDASSSNKYYLGLRPDVYFALDDGIDDFLRYFKEMKRSCLLCKNIENLYATIRSYYISYHIPFINKEEKKMSNLKLEVKLIDEDHIPDSECLCNPTNLIRNHFDEGPLLDEKRVEHIISKSATLDSEDITDTLGDLVSYFARNKINKMVLDIGELESSLQPAKEITIEEIEKLVGCKVKIVDKKHDE